MPSAQCEVWDVSEWEIFSDETEGVEEKYWLIDSTTRQRWLFKPPVRRRDTLSTRFEQRRRSSQRDGTRGSATSRPAARSGESASAIQDQRPGLMSVAETKIINPDC